MLYNFPQTHNHHPSQPQHHHGLQHDHGMSNANGLGHHSSYASGVLSNSSSFNPNALQNGHSSGGRGGQGPQNEMWQEQLRMYKEAERAHSAMTDQQQPHYYARLKASENRGIGGPPPSTARSQADNENNMVDRRRPWAIEKENSRQDWHNMDMSGQGLRNLAPELFRYQFLNELYIASNKLTRLPNAIGELRQLRHLDASYNQISDLPPELGMCTYLKQLLLFQNNIQQLPFELGSLHQLEVLGIEGNPLEPEVKQEIMEKGTKSLVNALREGAPSKIIRPFDRRIYLTYMCSTFGSRPAKADHNPRRCVTQPRNNQGLFVEHSLRQVRHPSDIRLHPHWRSQLGIPQGLHSGRASHSRCRLPRSSGSFNRRLQGGPQSGPRSNGLQGCSLAKVSRENHVREGRADRRRLRRLLQAEQIHSAGQATY